MIPRLIACAVLASLQGSAALSQTAPAPRSPTAQTPAPAVQAPVGHRQPRAADVPSDRYDRPEDETKKTADDIRLDRALRGVCRGC
jgi:hypothetical protein